MAIENASDGDSLTRVAPNGFLRGERGKRKVATMNEQTNELERGKFVVYTFSQRAAPTSDPARAGGRPLDCAVLLLLPDGN